MEYPGAAAAARRFEQAQRVKEALAVTAALAAPRFTSLTNAQRMETCPHCGAPAIDRENPEAKPKSVALRARMLRETAQALQGCSAQTWELIDAALATEHDGSAQRLAKVLGYATTALQSAMARRGLPSPRHVMRVAYLVRFWEVMQTARSVAQASDVVGASSPQSLTRTCISFLGITAGQFAQLPPAKVLKWAADQMKLERADLWKTLRMPPRKTARLTVQS